MSREAWVVFDLGFGDSGKGTITDFLVRATGATLLVRYNGGANAGHNVVTPDGRHHTFSQFGSGTLVGGVRTYLGPDFVLHPGGMLVESRHLRAEIGVPDALDRVRLDRRALVISPFQQAAGRLRELLRGPAAHGTCGVGLGETVADAHAGHEDLLRAGDLAVPEVLRRRLRRQQERKRAELRAARDLADARARPEWDLLGDSTVVERAIATWAPLAALPLVDEAEGRALITAERRVVFEGAQGVLLDQTWGFPPHHTWSDCTPAGALALLAGSDDVQVRRLGILRAYATRHGAGPLPTHDPAFDAVLAEPHNGSEGWQGDFRTGPLDLVLLHYALAVCGGADALAVTCLDRIGAAPSFCASYEADEPGWGEIACLDPGVATDLDHRRRLGELLGRVRPRLAGVPRAGLVAEVEERLGVPIAIESDGPTADAKRWRRRG